MHKFFNPKAALAVTALAFAGLFGPTAPAMAEGAWCATAGGRGGYTNCGYYTFRQCLAAVRGVGGTCQRNPHYARYDDDRPVRVVVRRVYYYYY